MKSRIAVILFNLGGPDKAEAIGPFLFNLFNDKAIISLPQPFRFLLAKLLRRRRIKFAKEAYNKIGGYSPLLSETVKQAQALENLLNSSIYGEQDNLYKVFVGMRYWHPLIEETAAEVKRFQPDQIVLLPLYPQFSTTTSGSAFKEWEQSAISFNLADIPTIFTCCYPALPALVECHTELIRPIYQQALEYGRPRILFSAHGLPQKVIEAGDPYQYHITLSVQAIVRNLAIDDLDYVICYQSKVGPLKWLGPSTEQEITRASESQIPIIVVPISFVSEHVETLVELDIEYKNMARAASIYLRVATPQTHPKFIQGLAKLCQSRNLDKNCIVNRKNCQRQFAKCGFSSFPQD